MMRLVAPFVLLATLVAVTVLWDRPLPKADISIINRGDVTSLDLQTLSWMQDLRVARLLFEGLVKNDTFTWEFRIVPALAERWEVSPDKRTYTFHLRDNAKWSNGEPVTVHDVVYAWRRGMLPDLAGDYTQQFHLVKGGRAFYDWREAAIAAFAARKDLNGEARRRAAEALWEQTKAKFEELVAMRAGPEGTLVIELESPTPYFLGLCTMPPFYPVYSRQVAAYERIDPATGRLSTEHDWTKPPRIVSNGPLKLDVWRFKRDMRLSRNEHYWDQSLLNYDTLAIPTVDDPNAQVLAFRTGAVDWVSDVTVPYISEMLAEKAQFYEEHGAEYRSLQAQGLDPVEIDRRLPPDPRNRISNFPAFGTYFYNFNCQERLGDGRLNPFRDAKVRKAFAMCIDRAAIAEQVRRRGEPEARSLIPPDSIPGYTPPKGVPFDPEAARRLLAEAGYPGGKGLPTIEILFNKDGGHDLIAQAVGKVWERELGVSVLLLQKEIKVFRDDLKTGKFMTGRAGWFGDYGDPTTFLNISRTGDGNNDRKYSNPRYDAMLDAAAAELDEERRMRILEECERLLMEEEFPMAPIFHYRQVYLFDPHRLTGISSHPRQEQTLYRCDVFGDGKGRDEPVVMPPRGRDK
ncbi:MAG: peptide ABC transporter substrate-binding protein [Phycisphaeraceae bacterium]|nr:peptide ABC transporter substrate-binding protein [Phycisphaeraceae bacterium]